ncbi:MAG: hypothetical protein RIA69_13180 [Cyclobacteriaceae bacterium]
MSRLTLLLTLVIVVFSYALVSAQVSGNILAENEVPPNLIAKHFSNYENSSDGKWYQDGAEFNISFINLGKPHLAKYNKSGRLLMESVVTDSFTPQQIEQHLASKFSKYKIVEIRAVRDLENDMEFYQVQVKSKSAGLVTEWYDRSLAPIDNFTAWVNN